MSASSSTNGERVWWRDGVVYQVYPRSWADSDGDGMGDLRGIIERLDYLEWLGVDALWLNPIMPSPNDDWGYDVSDYCDVHPELGSLADVEELVLRARERGMHVLLDLVPNHTSDRHPWFVESRSSRSARRRDWYVWADPKPDGAPPNNWLSVAGGPAWQLDRDTNQYYLHNFLASMPDLNWWNDEVRDAFDDILRFWFDRGIDGFRIDVAHGIVKDQALRDNLPATEEDHPAIRKLGQRQIYNMNRPEVHDVIRRWRRLSNGYEPARVLVGETWVLDLERMAAFYGQDDELHLAFNFPFIFSDLDPKQLREVVDLTDSLIPPEGWPVWTASNHDVQRFPTRWCGGDPAKIRCALIVLLTLCGTPFLYYGDEIGMLDTDLPDDAIRDGMGAPGSLNYPGRDPARTPMQWTGEPGAGFTSAEAAPWLPFGDYTSCNVADQRKDESSVLNFCRDLIALRRRFPDLQRGRYESIDSSDGVWAWRRGERTVVAINMSDDRGAVEGVDGAVLISTQRHRDHKTVRARLDLAPWEGVVISAPER